MKFSFRFLNVEKDCLTKYVGGINEALINAMFGVSDKWNYKTFQI